MSGADFETEVSRLSPTLLRYTRRFTSDRQEGEDLVQDTMLKALRYRSKFREDVNLSGWLYTIMRNTFINQHRHDARFRKVSTEQINREYLNLEDTHTFNLPDGNVSWKEITAAIDGIRDDIGLPFRLYTSGYKYHEIAEQLDIPLGTVKNRIFQARQAIQKRLAGYC